VAEEEGTEELVEVVWLAVVLLVGQSINKTQHLNQPI